MPFKTSIHFACSLKEKVSPMWQFCIIFRRQALIMHSLRYHTVLENNQISTDLLKPCRLPFKTNNDLWQIKEKAKFTWAGCSNLSRYQVQENELRVKSPKVYAVNYSKPREFLYKVTLMFLSRLDKFYSNKLKVPLKFIWHFKVNNHITIMLSRYNAS